MFSAKSVLKHGDIQLNTLISTVYKFNNINFKNFFTSLKNNSLEKHIEELAMKDDIFEFMRASELKSLIIHEQTHFLDLTSTNWGAHYYMRKQNYITAPEKEKVEKSEVFMLDLSEISGIHFHNNTTSQINSYLEVKTFNHEVRYDEKYGAIIFIILHYENGTREEVALSLLSVFESHAFSNEYLSRILDTKLIKSRDMHQKVLDHTLSSYNEYLNQVNLHEYNILNKLIHLHYDKYGLNLEQILRLTCTIMGLTLDLSGTKLSIVANAIGDRIINPLGVCIQADLMRSHSRHVFAFKSILMMYDYIEHIKEPSLKNKMISLLKNNPLQAICNTWDKYTNNNFSKENFMDKIELDFLDSQSNEIVFYPIDLIYKNFKYNNSAFNTANYVIEKLSNFKLLNMYRDMENVDSPDYIIEFPNAVKIHLDTYFYHANTSLLENMYKDEAFQNIKKFHLSQLQAEEMIQSARSQAKITPNARMVISF